MAAARRTAEAVWKTGDKPYAQSKARRYTSIAMFPCCCFPCILWSTLWRCCACPCMCIFKGCSYACADNGCTRCTDATIGAYCDEVDKAAAAPDMPDIKGAPRTELAGLVDLIDYLSSCMASRADADTKKKYLLVDHVIGPMMSEHRGRVTAWNANTVLDGLRGAVSAILSAAPPDAGQAVSG